MPDPQRELDGPVSGNRDDAELPSLRAELPPREGGWPLWVWVLVAAAALAVLLVAVNARLSWF